MELVIFLMRNKLDPKLLYTLSSKTSSLDFEQLKGLEDPNCVYTKVLAEVFLQSSK
jgi:hypothetical protein